MRAFTDKLNQTVDIMGLMKRNVNNEFTAINKNKESSINDIM